MQSLIDQVRMMRSFNRNARLFLIHSVIFGLGLSIIVLLFNLYILSLGFQQDTIGLITLVASFTTVVASIPAGMLMRALGWQRALFVSILGTAASIVISLLIPTLTGLIVTELVWGFFFAMLVLIGAPFMSENSLPEQRDAFFTLQFAITMLSFTTGNFFGGRLTQMFAGMLHASTESPVGYAGALWVSVGLISVSAFPFIWIQKPSGAGAHGGTGATPFHQIAQWGPVIKLLVIAILGGVAGGLFLPFVNVFWKLSFNLSDDRIGELFALSALLIACVAWLAPLLTKKWGRTLVIILAQFLSIPATVAFGLAGIYLVALVGYFLRDALYHMARPLLVALQMDQVQPTERAALATLLSVVWNLAWGAGSWVSGMWQVEKQLTLVFATTAVFQFASTLMLYLYFGRTTRNSRQ